MVALLLLLPISNTRRVAAVSALLPTDRNKKIEMTCCHCNRTGSCKNCSCAKAKRKCDNCQPGKLAMGRCLNSQAQATSVKTTTSSTPTTTTKVSPQSVHTVPPTTSPTIGNLSPNTVPPSTTPVLTSSLQRAPLLAPSTLPTTVAPLNTDQDYNFSWGEYSGRDIFDTVTKIYDEIIHWRHNLLPLPPGKASNSLVLELARLLQASLNPVRDKELREQSNHPQKSFKTICL